MIETTGVAGRYEVQPGRQLGIAAHRVTMRCAHGESTACLLPACGCAPTTAEQD